MIKVEEERAETSEGVCIYILICNIYIYIYISDVPCRVGAVRVGAVPCWDLTVRVDPPRSRVGI